MEELAREVAGFLRARGADLVAFADLTGVPGAAHPRGIALATALDARLVATLKRAPSRWYLEEYDRIYRLHDAAVEDCAALLRARGYEAFAQSRANVAPDGDSRTPLPHKTVARLAGLGWIGRCALLVTPGYGSAVRLSSLTTDAPLPVAAPHEGPGCGSCAACVDACPAGAVRGPAWARGAAREDIYEADACKRTARALSLEHIEGLREGITLCGRCIAACPHTEACLKRAARRTDPMTEKERMLAGKLYRADDGRLTAERDAARLLTARYNHTAENDWAARRAILRQLLGAMGEDVYIEPTFRCDYGSNIFIGDRFFANFDCIILDVAPVHIGDDVLFGPRVSVYAAGHPTDPEVRAAQLEFGRPVTIGSRAWIGGGATLNPGVSIGEEAIIGAGSVVTRDVPAGVLAAGAPCRVIREIGAGDAAHWQARRREYEEEQREAGE